LASASSTDVRIAGYLSMSEWNSRWPRTRSVAGPSAVAVAEVGGFDGREVRRLDGRPNGGLMGHSRVLRLDRSVCLIKKTPAICRGPEELGRAARQRHAWIHHLPCAAAQGHIERRVGAT
jgi:hypothetical protein